MPVRNNKRKGPQPLYMISVAAELAGMHPQTLRIYEQKGLITPARTPRNTRLYSEEDIERLKKIQEFTTRLGMNLAGVEKVLELECRINDLEGSIAALRAEVAEAAGRLQREVEAVHRSYRRELVPVSRGEIILRRRRR
ncbi:MAG: helix-turn-helix transcriptional regulator [Actinomycetota bacterium]|nr:helix-turn-helix transcriptional regulator [Actinomycetota bacterium]